MIQILSDEVINNIAAGEVIERPASVVKELVENSIDAASTRITIHIEDAGQKLIRITDNGMGMTREEINLSVKRHATSKLSSTQDLRTIQTLGFRGEALPSIAAVSKCTIASQSKDTAHPAWQIDIIGGKLGHSHQTSRAQGTTVEVADLFFNTPARKKFLRTSSTEMSQIMRIVEELSIACPDIMFSLFSNNKETLKFLPSRDTSDRIRNLLGKSHFDKLISIKEHHPGVRLEGFISKISHFSGSRKNQYFFVNNRPVTHRVISRALYESYHGRIPDRRHPTAIIKLHVNPEIVDVNVHPTKREVRIAQDNELYHMISQTIHKALTSVESSPVFSMPYIQHTADLSNVGDQRSHGVQEAVESFYSKNMSSFQKIFPQTAPAPAAQEYLMPPQDFKDASVRIIGQYCRLYILAESNGQLWIIDQHAAEERVLYERFLSDFKQSTLKQKLLIPYHWEVTASEFTSISLVLPSLNDIGIKIETFGTNSFIVREIPALLGSIKEIADFLSCLTDTIGTALDRFIPQQEHIIRAACRAAVKSRDYLGRPQIEELVKNLQNCSQPYTCPHGRPTLIRLPKHEIDRRFGR
ncbi:MAG: DNA mismatch repair endonuclease MutL [bacterium]